MELHFSSGTARSRRLLARSQQPADARAQQASERLGAETAAWLAVVPTAALALLAILVLGPPLGALMLPAQHARFWPVLFDTHPEETELARYLIALTVPLVLSALTVALVRRPELAPARATALARVVQVGGLLFVVACLVAQRLQNGQDRVDFPTPAVYFTVPTVAVALVVAAGIAAVLHSGPALRRAARWLAESRSRCIGAALVALVAVVITLLPAVYTDDSIENAFRPFQFHMYFTYDETMAVVNGRSPLGDFAAQYASLWPYLLAGAMSLVGASVASFTILVATLTSVTLLALYDVLRRVCRSSLGALLLFLPLLATTAFQVRASPVSRYSGVTYFGVMPLRYAGPFLLAWLLARHLDGARGGRDRRLWPLFLAGGLVVLNNTDFGLAALGATIAALAWAQAGMREEQRPGVRAQALEAAGGLAAAYALVAALLLARTGSPPDLSLLVRYAHYYVVEGFGMLAIRPVFGFYIAIFLTHVAAIGVATVRVLRRDDDPLLTGMLAWSGVFGLGAASYYVGQSLSEILIYTFVCWALSLGLLLVVTVRSHLSAPRWPSAATLACLVGFGLLVCSLAQTPAPWQQLQRISSQGPRSFAQPIGEPFVREHVRPGERVLIMALLGHRIAENLDVEDVEPYTGAKSLFTVEQFEDSLRALRAAGGRKLFVELPNLYGDVEAILERGFRQVAEGESMQLWVAR